MKKYLLIWLLLWPLAALAEGDFAWEWPLELSEPDAGVYEITLTEEVYHAGVWRDRRDVRVLDADGRVVDSTYSPAPEVTTTHTVTLPWFPLPAETRSGTDLDLAVQRDDSGRVISIRESGSASASSADPAWLIDLGEHAGQMRAIRVEWMDPDADVDLGYRVETSADLRQWRVLEQEIRLVQLQHDQRQLRRNDIPLSTGTQQRYLRLTPLQSSAAPALKALRGEVVQVARNDDWQWLELPVHRQSEDGFEYHAPGFFPVQRLDVEMPANSSVIWYVSTSDPGSAGGSADKTAWPWITRAGRWETWNLNTAGRSQRSPALVLNSLEINRHWRLQPASGALPSQAPVLRLGWRPPRLVFLAQGRAPYRLVAGNARAQEDRTHGVGITALRSNAIVEGAPWQPGTARLGARQLLAGNAAYEPAVIPRDWTTWVLWGVLILGTLVVAGFALSVLRSRPAGEAGDSET